MPSAQLNDGNSQSLDLSNPTPETIGQVTVLNKGATVWQDDKLSVPALADLQEINSLLGGDWRNLALVISTDDNSKMIGIPEREAKHKVIIHFAGARDKKRKNLEVPFDVTLNDLVTRIEHLLSADIHWLCLAYCLEQEEGDQLITKIFKELPDFNTFWSAFSMPHYDFGSNVEESYPQNVKQAKDNNRILMDELNALKTEIKSQDKSADLAQNDREFNKFCRFSLKETLQKYATSSGSKDLYEKFIQLSTIKIEERKWEAYLNGLGISQFKKKNPAKHNCITYGLENLDLCGEKVIGKNDCVGSLGWPLVNRDGYKCHLTSSHVLLGENRLKVLSKEENVNKMVKLEHTFLCQKIGIGCDLECYCFCKEMIGVISSGCYKMGNNVSAGVEIVVIENSKKYRLSDNDIRAGYRYYHWKMFGFPDTLNFRCQFWNRENIEMRMVVYKLGHVTGLTKGCLTRKESLFEFQHPFSKDKKKPLLVTLHNQYEVAWDGPEFPFSKEGDSGGPVFTVNNETGEITAVGLLTGNNVKKEISFVTPLDQVLEIVGTRYSLKNFEITLKKIQSNLH
ncbi:uncharacterized protein LOC128552157 isoform X2 [Mercenaria mercenaria]|nr:uncharacterized protein LOC128552157 isoform X2 [Mercenaria mercenaria]XP_053389153.1 uncharacterized protein LOC128552157 isoform X2 [Mercenaria mercenaria]